MKLLDDALEDLKKGLLEATPDEKGLIHWKNQPFYDLYHSGEWGRSDENFCRLRLDWELAWDPMETEQVPPFEEHIATLMFHQCATDLEDLIINGDVHNHKDALLKAMNGSKVRGKKPTKVAIAQAVLQINPVGRKSSTEYTLWTNLYTKWD